MSGLNDLFEEPNIVPVSLDGKTIYVRELTGTEIYEAYEKSEKSGTGLVVQLLERSICDEKGRRMATEADVRRLSKRWLDALFDEAGKLNGIGVTEKNFEAGLISVS